MSLKKRSGGARAIPAGLLMSALCLMYLLPFAVLLLLSLSPKGLNFATLLNPAMWSVANFTEAWDRSGIWRAMFNSLVTTTGSIVLIILIASMAGFVIARFPNRPHRVFFGILLACMMIPGIINMVPLYTLLINLDMRNNLLAMILVCTTNALPFSVFLYSGFVRSIPREMEEAAIIDGCSWFGAFWRITFRYLQPVTAAVVILNGVSIWNNYAQAVFLLQTEEVRTIPLAISLFFQQYGAEWHLVAASACMAILPMLALFLSFQRFFISGMTAGAVKG